jgi:chemotaxis signal transduction protein
VLGFSPLRGDVITLVDVRAALGLGTRGFWEPPMMIVIGFEGHLVGIAIDSSLGLVRANPRPLDELPLRLRGTGSRWLRASIHPGAGDEDAGRFATLEPSMHPIAVIELAGLLTHSGLIVEQVG